MSDFVAFFGNVKIIKCLKGGMPQISSSSGESPFPPTDVFEGNGILKMYADMPGVAPKDVSVYIYEGYIVIEGVKDFVPHENHYRFLRLERRRMNFRRIFKLPFPIYRYEAGLIDGVLTISLAGY